MALTRTERTASQKNARAEAKQTRANAGWKVYTDAWTVERQERAARMTRVTLLHRIDRLLTDHPKKFVLFQGLISEINARLREKV